MQNQFRQALDIPIDIYVEVPDDIGGYIRHYEIPEIIRVAAPVYIKFGLRNSPNIYPASTHLEQTSIALCKERVRRARIGLDMIKRYSPGLKTSERGAAGLGVPVVVSKLAYSIKDGEVCQSFKRWNVHS